MGADAIRAALCAAACTLTGTKCSGSLLFKAQRLSGRVGDKQRKIVGGPRSSQGAPQWGAAQNRRYGRPAARRRAS